MSSFVINKQEYIKAGGFFAGLADQLTYYHNPVIYWWTVQRALRLTPRTTTRLLPLSMR